MKGIYMTLWVLMSVLISNQTLAQGTLTMDPLRHTQETIAFMNDGNGRPFKPARLFEEEGSPFFAEEYIESNIQLLNGKTYQRIPIKINYLTGELLFKMGGGQEMTLIKPFQRIELMREGKKYIFRSGFPSVDKQNELTLYEMLDSGSAVLLKYTSVNFQDKQPYNSVNTIRTYTKKQTYYSYLPSKGLVSLPSEAEELIRLFGKEASIMAEFMQKNKLKGKKETDLIKLFAYYNTIKKPS